MADDALLRVDCMLACFGSPFKTERMSASPQLRARAPMPSSCANSGEVPNQQRVRAATPRDHDTTFEMNEGIERETVRAALAGAPR